MQAYHDEEWGRPVHDDRVHFEFLVLEAAQAGLSWSTILKRREGYRKAYRNFDPVVVADFEKRDIERLLSDTGIIRNRRKIESSIRNAACFLEIQQEHGSFDAWIWSFVDNRPVTGAWSTQSDMPVTTELAKTVSKTLKTRGFSFVGPTIVYSHLQATGVVNDHITSCFCYQELTAK